MSTITGRTWNHDGSRRWPNTRVILVNEATGVNEQEVVSDDMGNFEFTVTPEFGTEMYVLTIGHEMYVLANATSIISGANATTGWVNGDGVGGEEFGTFESSAAQQHDGSWSLHLTADGVSQRAATSVTVVVGHQYRATVYYYGVNLTTQSMRMRIGSADELSDYLTSDCSTDGAWTSLTVDFVATTTAVFFSTVELSALNTCDFYIDAVSLKEISPANATNIGDEEDATVGWTNGDGAGANEFNTFESSAGQHYSGTHSMHFIAVDDEDRASTSIPVVIGRRYQISLFYYGVNFDQPQSYLWLKVGTEYNDYSYDRLPLSVDETWTEYTLDFTATETILTLTPGTGGTNFDAEFYIDAVSVKEILPYTLIGKSDDARSGARSGITGV